MFQNCKNEQEIKELYRKLAKRLHPDSGGDHSLMILLTNDYETALMLKASAGKQKADNARKKKNNKHCSYSMTSDSTIELGDTNLMIIDDILHYAEKNKSFDTKFVNSISDFLTERGYITGAQYNKLVNIYRAFRMDNQHEHC